MSEQAPICVVCDGCGWCEGSPAFTCPQCGGEGLDREFYKPTPSPVAASGVPLEVGMIEQFCRDLNDAHNEILRLQGVQPEDYSKYDWPEWSAPANSIRWAERVLGKPLSKTSLRSSPLPAEAQEPWQFTREAFDAGWQAGRASVQPPDGWFNTFSSKEEAYQQWAHTHGGRE
jgi:hypothetical protein